MSYETKIILALLCAWVSGFIMALAMVSMMSGNIGECRAANSGNECAIGWVPTGEDK